MVLPEASVRSHSALVNIDRPVPRHGSLQYERGGRCSACRCILWVERRRFIAHLELAARKQCDRWTNCLPRGYASRVGTTELRVLSIEVLGSDSSRFFLQSQPLTPFQLAGGSAVTFRSARHRSRVACKRHGARNVRIGRADTNAFDPHDAQSGRSVREHERCDTLQHEDDRGYYRHSAFGRL